ncbi:hypothetical protein BU26DRAFT_525547 [Trematosphaeria pertusa]|uniref:N-acetyltransferase domain-containing protein n=1 Tax=Trematosphaeria pertusa TaxID=390896 RepID=A0A6A6HU07_9PLEO|nr:uncharacterized protein BU26DRAFT_525547 [Trematosphaeria pertusa]KAF2241013.1 hypothetical protein BU26DRAFT_525547 [Trematosphaeria pertusa]
MAKTIAPVAVTLVESKSSLKSANVQVNDVPTSFRLLQQKPTVSVVPPPTDGVRIVTAAEYKEAAACLAEAFAEDDVARYFIDVPDRAHWTEEEKWDLHVEILEYVTYAHILKGLVTTIGDFDAVALWMPPGKNMDDFLTILRSGMWRLNYRLSAEGKRRFFNEFLPLLHDTKHATLGDRDDDSWYLVYIGTKPSGRGKGYARKLIEHVTKQADREGRAVYLESSNEKNPPIYRRFGFEDRRTIHLQRAEKNVQLDIMVREPAAQEKKLGRKP